MLVLTFRVHSVCLLCSVIGSTQWPSSLAYSPLSSCLQEKHQYSISVRPRLMWTDHQSLGLQSVRSCPTSAPWSSAQTHWPDSPHPGSPPSSSLGSGPLTSPGGWQMEKLEVCSNSNLEKLPTQNQECVLTSVRACRVVSLGFSHCNVVSVVFRAFSLRCSTKEDCCCWRILSRSLMGTGEILRISN